MRPKRFPNDYAVKVLLNAAYHCKWGLATERIATKADLDAAELLIGCAREVYNDK